MTVISDDGLELKVELTCGTVTILNSEDGWILKAFPVWAMTGSRSRYVVCQRSVKTEYSLLYERIYLHRLIVKPPPKFQVDHVNRDRLDNRRSNLRHASRSQNMANVGPRCGKVFKGVSDEGKHRPNLKKPFRAYIDGKCIGLDKRIYLGAYLTPEEAAKAYDKKAFEIYGEFAYLNFPDEINQPSSGA